MVSFKEFLMEASSGQAKWDKYFGSSDVETIAKKDSILLDLSGNPTKDTISKGDKLIVLAGDYSTLPKVKVGAKKYIMKFVNIDKPFKVNLEVKGTLKPDQIGLFGPISMSAYVSKVKKLLDEHSGIPELQTEYLKALIDLAEDMDDEEQKDYVRDLYIMTGVQDDSSLKNTINNDFMEVLGPLFVINEKPEYKIGGVRFPEAGNEPLYDFTMKVNGVIDSFSSKRSGGNTNTLKVSEVLKAALDSDQKIKRKYAREIELLKIINDNTVKAAPDKINEWLSKTFKNKYIEAPATIDNTSIARLEASVVKWINDNSDLDFVPLVQQAIPDLWYVKSRLNTDGTLKIEPLKSGRELDVVKIRSKSSPNHLSDKLGFAL